MTRRQIVVALSAAIALQVIVLAGMVAGAAVPLWTGTEVRVATLPVDPRSLFRGNYARLDYAFSTLPEDALDGERRLRQGEVVYVRLEAGEDGLHRFAGASLERPAGGVFLRGRLVGEYPPHHVRYGIEAFFAPKEKALRLEEELRDGGGVAVLKVSAKGRAAIEEVIPPLDQGPPSGQGSIDAGQSSD